MQYIPVLGEVKNYEQENIIVEMVSTNICLLCGTLFYAKMRKKFKHQNIFVVVVMCFKKRLQ